MMFGFMGFGMVFVWLFLFGGVALAVWAGGSSVGHCGHSPQALDVPREDAIETLRARYARGEIERTQFQQALEDLRRG